MKLVISFVETWVKQVLRQNWMYKNLLKITLWWGGKSLRRQERTFILQVGKEGGYKTSDVNEVIEEV